MRIDVLMAERGLVKSRSKAKEFIDSGFVFFKGNPVSRASFDISPDEADNISLIGAYDYVSRGALKLECAIETFKIDPQNKICCDIGASTGGFTECLLRYGASHVFAIDSGEGQLDFKLLSDPRVTSLEKFNARYITPETVGGHCDIITCDVSFISQTLIIPPASALLSSGGEYISLIKPQFECSRSEIGSGGIVKSKKSLDSSVKRVRDCFEQSGFTVIGIIDSPIKGGDGNSEYLIYCIKN